jgi:hypothetical protein
MLRFASQLQQPCATHPKTLFPFCSQLLPFHFIPIVKTMQSILNSALFFGPTTYTAGQLAEMYRAGVAESKQGESYSQSANSYLEAIGTYLNADTDRPACTLAHVTALVQFPDFHQVLDLLASDPASARFISHLQQGLAEGAKNQVAGVITTLQHSFAHLTAGYKATQRINIFLQQEAVAVAH